MKATLIPLLKIVAYAVAVMVGFSILYFTLGSFIAGIVLNAGGSESTARLAQAIVSMVGGFGLGEVLKRWLARRFAD